MMSDYDSVWTVTTDLRLECLKLAVEAAKARDAKSVPVLELAQTYYDWLTK
jgi:hypothetical protein